MKPIFAALFASILVLNLATAGTRPLANEYTLVPELCVVTLRISNSILGRFDAVSKNGLTGKIIFDDSRKALVARDLQFSVATLDSGIGLRDGHIKTKYLEADKFPFIVLALAETKLNGVLNGLLTVKGVSKAITGQSNLFLKDETLRGTVEFQGSISNYPIEKPRYMGLGVKDQFTVQVDVVARPEIQDEGAAESGL